MARDADRGAGTRIIADRELRWHRSLHTPSTRVEAGYASGELAITSGHADIVVTAGVVSCRGIKLALYTLQVTLGRAASWALQDL